MGDKKLPSESLKILSIMFRKDPGLANIKPLSGSKTLEQEANEMSPKESNIFSPMTSEQIQRLLYMSAPRSKTYVQNPNIILKEA